MRRRTKGLFMVLAMAVMVAATAIPAVAGPEGTLVSRINSSRSASGLAPLETYWDLTDDARAQSARMMNSGEIYHNPSLSAVTGVWQKLGENVGMGVDLNTLHDAFMSSSAHRGNILGDYNYVGVGVKTDSAGVQWVTVIFMKAAPGLNGESTTTTTQPPTTTTQPSAPTTSTTTLSPATTTTIPAVTAAPTPEPVAVKASERSESAPSAPRGEIETAPWHRALGGRWFLAD